MRYYCSDWYPYNLSWKEVDVNVSHEDLINKILRDDFHVYDADNCGDDTIYFVINDGNETKYFMVEHSWWIKYDPEWEIHNDYTIDEVKKEDTKDLISDRDFIVVSNRIGSII